MPNISADRGVVAKRPNAPKGLSVSNGHRPEAAVDSLHAKLPVGRSVNHLGEVSGAMPLDRDRVSILSPLRFPGSKRRLAGYIARTLELNRLQPELLVEPFAGGASVALRLLNDGLVKRIGLADRDPLVASFWKTVFYDADWLVQKVRSIDVTLERWEQLKRRIPTDTRGQALACLFLNRTSFSGILAPNAGPIGGKKQESAYDIACRFPRDTLEKRIRQAEGLSDRVAFVWNVSWPRCLQLVASMQAAHSLPGDTFWYLDPPFFARADRLYRYFFLEDEHVRLRNALLSLKDNWMLSYDSLAEVGRLYQAARQPTHVEALYSTSSNGHVPMKEAIVTNLRSVPDETRLWKKSVEWKRNGTLNGHDAASPPMIVKASRR